MIVSSDSLPCDPHPVIYEQITGPLVRSVALKTEGSAGPSGIDAQGWRGDGSAPLQFNALPLLNSCMKDRCGFLFVCYKRHCCTELVSWEHTACPLSGIKKRPLVGGWLNTSSEVSLIGATASVRCRGCSLVGGSVMRGSTVLPSFSDNFENSLGMWQIECVTDRW